MNTSNENRTVDLGNNERMSAGVFPNSDRTYTAMTFSQSKTFKTERGAQRWYARKTGKVS